MKKQGEKIKTRKDLANTELTEEDKTQLLKDFDATVNKLYRNWKRLKANKDIKISSSTISDPIQLKLIAMSINHAKLYD